MKKLLLMFSAALLAIDAASATDHPKWLADAFIYQIYPSSYMDSDGDGMGDLNGIRSRLDHIKSVGFNCIWISPCFESNWEDGGYDITDFYKIDPRFGTNEDLEKLVAEAHAKGIKVCLDLVAGHTSDKHPWFKESCKTERNKYSDYFIWTDGKEMEKPEKRFVDNNHSRDGYYMKNFYDIQPALNYGYCNPDPAHPWEQGYDDPGPTAVRNELKNIIAFWCDKGVDGYRVDMAGSLVKGDNDTQDGTCRLWNEIFSWYREKYPENIMMSEWGMPEKALRAGFDIDLFAYGERKTSGRIYRRLFAETSDKMAPTVCYFNKKGNGDLHQPIKDYTQVVEISRKLGGYATMPTCSHDMWRLSRMNRNTPEEQKVTITMALTLPAPPIVYYGEEIGMRNLEYAPVKEGSMSRRNRSSCRTPMQWDTTKNAGFSTVDDAEKLYQPVDNAPEYPNVATQNDDPKSVLNYVRGLIALRKATPALGTSGDWEYVGDLDNPYPMIYKRSLGDEKYVVVFNPSDRKVSGDIAKLGKKVSWVYGNDAKLAKCKTSADKHTFTMQPISVAIFKISE